MTIIFEKGIPGFEEYTKYKLKDIENYEPFKVLESEENNELSIEVISPFEINNTYEIKLSDSIINRLKIESSEDVMLLSTVTLNSDASKITTNLRAPFVINIKNGFGEQLIIDNEKYKIKHPIYS